MLEHELVLMPQEVNGNYLFDAVPVVTRNFQMAFGKESILLVFQALNMITETYENPDKLQQFMYGDRKFWVIADFKRGDKAEDYMDTEYLYVTFLLPEDY